MASALMRSRLLRANLPPRAKGVTLNGTVNPLAPMRNVSITTRPEGALARWMQQLSDGKILRAVGHYETCGLGLFLSGRRSTTVAAAMLQDLLISESIESGLYVMAEDYLSSERPDGDRRFTESVWSDVVVLAGLGTERRTDFARETLEGLMVRRFDKGLPTIVASGLKMNDLLSEDLAAEAFRQIAIMEVAGEED